MIAHGRITSGRVTLAKSPENNFTTCS